MHDVGGQEKSDQGFKITDQFSEYATGIQTKRDAFCLQSEISKIAEIKSDLVNLDTELLRNKYTLVADNRDWSIEGAREDLALHNPSLEPILHRPFDVKKPSTRLDLRDFLVIQGTRS